MQIIEAGYQLINEPSITKKIERIARICYKSEDKIGEGTDAKMIDNLVGRNHLAMLEHASLAFCVDAATYNLLIDAVDMIQHLIINAADKKAERCYLRFTQCAIPVEENLSTSRFIVSGNMRAWIETLRELEIMNCVPPVLYEGLMTNAPVIMEAAEFTDAVTVGVGENYEYKPFEGQVLFAHVITDFTQLTDEERLIHEDVSVLFTVDRGVTHELVRMRDCSFAQESTRYCNYSLGKYNREITVIEPCFFARPDGVDLPTDEWAEKYGAWRTACEECEKAYFRLLDAKATPQQARDVLPTSVKADIVMTTNLREWRHIFELRACDSTGPAHPQMKEVMIPCLKELRDGAYNFAFGDLVAADEVTK